MTKFPASLKTVVSKNYRTTRWSSTQLTWSAYRETSTIVYSINSAPLPKEA